MNTATVVIWDLPTRLFHWALVLLIALQYASGEFHWFDMQWHLYAGYATLTLLLFRVIWGFVGSDSARFARFVRGPGGVLAYLRGGAPAVATHNPIGGWATVIMLTLLFAIVISGLAASDDIDVFGPLTQKLDDATIRAATRWHHRLVDALPWLIALHVLAVLVHEWRGERLVAGMLHGRRRIDADAPLIRRWPRALLWLLLCVAAVWALLRYAAG